MGINKLIRKIFFQTIERLFKETAEKNPWIAIDNPKYKFSKEYTERRLKKYLYFELGSYLLYETYAILVRCEGPLFTTSAEKLLDDIIEDYLNILQHYGVIGNDIRGTTNDIIQKRLLEYHSIRHLGKEYQSNLFCLHNLEYISSKNLELQTIQPSIKKRLHLVTTVYERFGINDESQLKKKYSSSSQFEKNLEVYTTYIQQIKSHYINKNNLQEKMWKIFKYCIILGNILAIAGLIALGVYSRFFK